MATFGELKTDVSKRILDPSNTAVSSSDVAASINDALRYWKYREFWFNRVSDTVTLTIEDATIPLTGNFLVATKDDGAFTIQYSDMRYPLVKITDTEYNYIFLDNGYGMPDVYARVGQEFKLYPIPDRAYTLRRDYLKDYDDLVSDSDTNDFTVYAGRLLMLWSCANVIAEFRRDMDMEAYFRTAARDEFNQLIMMTTQSNASGKLTIDSYL